MNPDEQMQAVREMFPAVHAEVERLRAELERFRAVNHALIDENAALQRQGGRARSGERGAARS
jgi:hypothetical protein